jgi:hypothetical protein
MAGPITSSGLCAAGKHDRCQGRPQESKPGKPGFFCGCPCHVKKKRGRKK